jgi:hypothetical protein
MKLSHFVLLLVGVAGSTLLRSQTAPEENRLSRVILDEKLNEPELGSDLVGRGGGTLERVLITK